MEEDALKHRVEASGHPKHEKANASILPKSEPGCNMFKSKESSKADRVAATGYESHTAPLATSPRALAPHALDTEHNGIVCNFFGLAPQCDTPLDHLEHHCERSCSESGNRTEIAFPVMPDKDHGI